MATTRLLSVQSVETHRLGKLEEVFDPAGPLETLVERVAGTKQTQIAPVLLVQRRDVRQRLLQAGLVAGHAAMIEHDLAQFLVEPVDGTGPVGRQISVHAVGDVRLDLPECRVIVGDGAGIQVFG